MDIKQFIIHNWKSADALRTLLGTKFEQSSVESEFDFHFGSVEQSVESEYFEFHFGSIPPEQAAVHVKAGKIVRITTWSGINWFACGQYAKPKVDIHLRETEEKTIA